MGGGHASIQTANRLSNRAVKRSSRPITTVSLLILSAVMCLLSIVDSDFKHGSFLPFARAEDEDEDALSLDPSNGGVGKSKMPVQDFQDKLDQSNGPTFRIDSISPAQGPISGETRVLVRVGPLKRWMKEYPEPKCKFGNNGIVKATYVTCTKEEQFVNQLEGRGHNRVYLCLQCDNNEAVFIEQTQQFAISLTGDFTDCQNQMPFTYYPNPRISAIYPRYGPKDGGTPVQVWGENFRAFGNYTRCGFGTKTSIGYVKSDTYMECESMSSDVVQKPIPFTISQNNQQNSRDTLFFWYYNWPHIQELKPNRGPESGGTVIKLKGSNFYPFKEEMNENNENQCDGYFCNNVNDTFCGFTELKVRVPAVVTNSTRATCVAPPSYYWRETRVEITLNGVEYTEDEEIFYYYKPPFLFDVVPQEGPLKGGNSIILTGSGFEDTGDIKCDFGGTQTKGIFRSASQIECIVPKYHTPGFVDLRISLKDNLWSSAIPYLYYEAPEIDSIGPICGPDTGYTQIEVHGKNFVDLGHNKAMCVFNQTIFTNATIMENDLIMCDSPPFQNNMGYSYLKSFDVDEHSASSQGSHGNSYQLSITVDGGKEIINGKDGGISTKFTYYKQAVIDEITPVGGPLEGKTEVTIISEGLQQPGLCDIRARFSTQELKTKIIGTDTLQVEAPKVKYPGQAVVQVTYNGQQWQSERVAHNQDPKTTYHYYDEPLVTFHQPMSGPSSGKTKIKISGHNLAPLKNQLDQRGPDGKLLLGNDGKPLKNKLWGRFVDPETGKLLAPATQVKPEDLNDDEASWETPILPSGTKALFQISPNNKDWTDVKAPKSDYSYSYYEAPHITKIGPTFGPVKDDTVKMAIEGTDFECPDGDCKDLRVKFGEGDNAIYQPATRVSSTQIDVMVPKYTKPDVLKVELTLNGHDYTNDKKDYGYYDPYVIDVYPKLIAVDGSTKIKIKGIGFVNSGELKGIMANSTDAIQCSGGPCIHKAEFVDSKHITMESFPQKDVLYKNGTAVGWEPIEVEASVYGDQFTNNKITLQYYEEPVYGDKLDDFDKEAPANVQHVLLVKTKINPRDIDKIRDHSNPKCRFKSDDGHVEYSEGVLMTSPVTQARDRNGLKINPNTVKCKSPIWNLNGKQQEKVKMDIAINGQNFSGNFDFTFTEVLKLHRTVPMAGPIYGGTRTRLVGTGFRLSNKRMDVGAKWGVIQDTLIQKADVLDYIYQRSAFENMIVGSEELKAYWYEAHDFKRVDEKMFEDFTYNSAYQTSSRVLKGTTNTSGTEETFKPAYGGPWYVEVGTNIKIPYGQDYAQVKIGGLQNQALASKEWTYYDYEPASVEYYQYTQPKMVSMHPHSGLTRGGTQVEVVGLDFRYQPEYGVVPHCKFGDKIVRATFDSTVRIVCTTPPSDVPLDQIAFEVSLNGVDWTKTGFTFSYYHEPKLASIFPISGPIKGGTEVYFKGKNFPSMMDSRKSLVLKNNGHRRLTDAPSSVSEYNCRFTPKSVNMPPKFMPVKYINDTMIMCATPGGWSRGDKMHLQVTFNGGDYDQEDFEFTVYNVAKAFPRSGPSNGESKEIIITGQGFHPDSHPQCRMNHTVSEPTFVKWGEIHCSIPPSGEGDDYYGNVDFAVTPNGKDWHQFEGGFQYYPQPVVTDISPKQGPARGVGVINFYGSGFRADFPLAELGCKVGKSKGQAYYVNKSQIRCVIEDIETVPEGELLPASLALNSYSWTKNDEDNADCRDKVGGDEACKLQFVPYSVSQILPASGPTIGGSEVMIQGRGFVASPDVNDQPRCRFGSPSNYAIVDAEILSYNRMICKTPPGLDIKNPEEWPMDVPFGIALTNDNYQPYTETAHKFRFYNQPVLKVIEPDEGNVGALTEVTVSIEPNGARNNIFFDPIPNSMAALHTDSAGDDDVAIGLAIQSSIKCKFGRFGESIAVYLNETHVKCVTPSIPEEADDIGRETVAFTLSMNGQDYHGEDDDEVEYTFIGTGSSAGLGWLVILIILIGPVVAGFIFYTQTQTQVAAQQPRFTHAYGTPGQAEPHTGVYNSDPNNHQSIYQVPAHRFQIQ